MPRWYDFSNAEYQFQDLHRLRILWRNIPDPKAINAIAEAHQYYDFLKTMVIGRLQSWSDSPQNRPDWHTPSQLALSARAGAVSSSVVVGASIIECAMRAHAENRNITSLIKKKPRHRTFGTVISSWEKHQIHSREITSVLEDIKRVHGKRNDIHLYASFGRNWKDVEAEEMNLVNSIENLFVFFQNLQPAD